MAIPVRLRSDHSDLIHGDFMTCLEMLGNGSTIVTSTTTARRRPTVALIDEDLANSALFEGELGTAPGPGARRPGITSNPPFETMFSVFEWSGLFAHECTLTLHLGLPAFWIDYIRYACIKFKSEPFFRLLHTVVDDVRFVMLARPV